MSRVTTCEGLEGHGMDACPKCGCPAHRLEGRYYTWDENGQYTREPVGKLLRCLGCGILLYRVPATRQGRPVLRFGVYKDPDAEERFTIATGGPS